MTTAPGPSDYMAAWEAMNDARKHNRPMVEAWDRHGTAAMRETCATITRHACTLWDSMTDDQRETVIPFDWDFLPRYIAAIADWNGPDPVTYAQLGLDDEDATHTL